MRFTQLVSVSMTANCYISLADTLYVKGPIDGQDLHRWRRAGSEPRIRRMPAIDPKRPFGTPKRVPGFNQSLRTRLLHQKHPTQSEAQSRCDFLTSAAPNPP